MGVDTTQMAERDSDSESDSDDSFIEKDESSSSSSSEEESPRGKRKRPVTRSSGVKRFHALPGVDPEELKRRRAQADRRRQKVGRVQCEGCGRYYDGREAFSTRWKGKCQSCCDHHSSRREEAARVASYLRADLSSGSEAEEGEPDLAEEYATVQTLGRVVDDEDEAYEGTEDLDAELAQARSSAKMGVKFGRIA